MSGRPNRALARYARQIVLPEIGVNGQTLLRDSSVAIVGLGGLGSVVALYLAAAGIGKLSLIDRDEVDVSNLQRQLLYSADDLGRPKTEAAHARLARLNAEVELRDFVGTPDDAQLRQLASAADLVLDCSDNFPTRFAINRACVTVRRPLVSAAAIRFEGQVALFDASRGGACYACLYDEHGEAGERCEDAGVLGPVVGVVGSLQALIAIRTLLGLGRDAGRLHMWNAMALSWKTLPIEKDPLCSVCGAPRAAAVDAVAALT